MQIGEHLGDIWSWKLPDPGFRVLAVGTAESLDIRFGVDLASLVPVAPSDETVLARVRTAATARGRFDVPRVVRTPGRVVYEVNARNIDDATETASYEHNAHVTLDTTTGIATTTGPAGERMVSAYTQSRGCLMRDEWSKLACSVVAKLKARAISETGGAYWSPVGRDGKTEPLIVALGELFQTFGGRVRCYETLASQNSVRTLREDAREGFVADLQALRDEIDSFGDRTREATIADRLQQLDNLKERAVWVASLLRESARGFDDAIAVERERLKRLLLGLD